MNKLKELNDLLRRFNFTEKDLTKFESHIQHTLKKLPTSQIKIQKGEAIYRCRKYDSPIESLFHFESDLSYRKDLNNISNFGRCNVPGNSAFYGSKIHYSNKEGNLMSKSQATHFGYLTAILETTLLLDHPKSSKKSEGVEVYGIGMWEATEDLNILIAPPNLHLNERSDLSNELSEVHENNMTLFNASNEIREFYQIIGKEFSKDMYDKPNAEYGISALFAAHVLRSCGGVAYCSVKTENRGFNIALSPDTVDRKFKFMRAGTGELWKFGKYLHFRFIATAERSQGIPLNYIPEPSLENMTDYFRNKGINPDHIIEVLIKSNYTTILNRR